MNKLNSENINGLITIDADTINANSIIDTNQTSTNIYGTNLYINNQLINFGSYVTSSYLTSQLNNYVLSSYLSSVLNNYATNNALSSYRLISDSWSRSDVTNEIVIRVGDCGTNNDGSITTAKQYIDNATAGLSTGIATNAAATAGVIASLATTNATVTGLVASVATLDGQVSTLQTKTMYQSTGTGLSGPYTQFVNNLNISNGVSNAVELKSTGEITCSTLTTTNIQPNSTTINISGNNINIGGLTSTIYINGLPYSAFNQLSFLNQW